MVYDVTMHQPVIVMALQAAGRPGVSHLPSRRPARGRQQGSEQAAQVDAQRRVRQTAVSVVLL